MEDILSICFTATLFLAACLVLFSLIYLASSPLSPSCMAAFRTRKASAKKIVPFIKKFQVDDSEFAPAAAFPSFDAFFTRKLHPECRPLEGNPGHLIIPADGRYLFFPDRKIKEPFLVKGKSFDLPKLLQSFPLAEEYREGAMAIARLCPTDYHRFHFPCDCVPGPAHPIQGRLASVNPLATNKRIQIYWENKRAISELKSSQFGKILFIEVGAICVGTIHQSYIPFQFYKKGDEKGYFSFGGSCLILLFPPGAIQFDHDLLKATEMGLEIRCLMGQSMAKHA